MSEFKAALFDLDGTMLDNNQVHYDSWKKYLEDNGMELTDEDFKKNISGRTNHDAVEHIYDKKMSVEEASKIYLQKEAIYRELYAPEIKPINGLLELLTELDSHGIEMAIATSGIQVNIDFMFQHVPVQRYFKKVINSKDISNGKPDPEIFLKAAEALAIDAANCIVFEDSVAGVKAGKSAGMKVIALTTSHSQQELKDADLVVKDYSEVTFEQLTGLLR